MEEVEIGEGWLDDDSEGFSLVSSAVYEVLDLLHITVKETGHLISGERRPSEAPVEAGTDPPVGQVTEGMLVKHVLNTETSTSSSLTTHSIYQGDGYVY